MDCNELSGSVEGRERAWGKRVREADLRRRGSTAGNRWPRPVAMFFWDGPAAPPPPVTVRSGIRQSRNDRAAPETRLPGEIQLGEVDDGGSRIQAAQFTFQQALTLNAIDPGSGPSTY